MLRCFCDCDCDFLTHVKESQRFLGPKVLPPAPPQRRALRLYCNQKSQPIAFFFCDISRKKASPLRFGWRRGRLRQKIAVMCNCDFWCSQVLTDLETLERTASFHEDMQGLGVQFHPMVHLDMSENLKSKIRFSSWVGAYQKLQVFNLTAYDRLVWVDSDAMVTREMDHLFQLQGYWAAR